MARNRKKKGAPTEWVPAIKAVLMCMLLAGTASGYVLQKNKLQALGREIHRREAELQRLQVENRLMNNRLSNLLMPQRLAEQVRARGLGLVPPQPEQIIWLTDQWPQPRNQPNELLISRAQALPPAR